MAEPVLDEQSLFHRALEITSAEDRSEFLDAACSGDRRLRQEVEALLRAHEGTFGLLDAPDLGSPTAEEPVKDRVGVRIGPYKLLQEIGEGGMGTVYMAEQTHPMRRTVALKLIKAGMDSRQVLARFDAERQALALMDHPNIAKVLDAGAAESGRPYFVMELVKGIPITRFCDERRLTIRERLELAIPVCQAVQHAHQKGIVHRDLKPSNIMIALYDGKPVPKVIDFGVAKATGPRLTDQTLYTEFGAVVGTLEYMSPEQAELNQLDIDTRSDIYSLGVLIYELLTGSTPLDRKRFKEAGFLEMLQVIREEEPPRPSTRLSTTRELPSIAANRGLESSRLRSLMRGELDWIVMRCLEKDRDRRYGTASDLVHDILRYLNDEPVLACPPSPAYRSRKFMRRNRRALAAAGVALAGLILAVFGLAFSAALARQAKTNVETALGRERRSSYFLSIALADREWSANNLVTAGEILERCPPDLRGWEWRYLKRLAAKAPPLMRHANDLYACAISPDGKQLVTSDSVGFLYFWDPDTGQELHRPIRGHDAICYFAAFSPDGGLLASSEDEHVKVWDAKTHQELRDWKTPVGTVQGLAFSPEGRLMVCLADRSDDGEDLSIWDAMAGKQLFALPRQQLTVHALSISPDGKLLATASGDRTVRIWDADTGMPVRTFHGDTGFWCVAFDPLGRLLAAGGGSDREQGTGSVKIWEVGTWRERPTPSGHGAVRLAFSPNGDRLATGGVDQAVRLWDTASGQEILTLRGHSDWIMGLVFTPDDDRLISASSDRTARIWDARPWRDGERAGEELFVLRGHTDAVVSLAFHPHERRLATASSDGSIKLWDTQTGRNLGALHPGIRKLVTMAFDADGKRLAAAGRDRFVAVLDATTGAELLRMGEHPEGVSSVAFSPSGRHLASGDEVGVVSIMDLVTSSEVLRRRGSPYLNALAFSPDPDGRLLAAAFADGTIRIWDTRTKSEIAQSPLKHQGMVNCVAFSLDGRSLASAGWDRAVRTWDTATWRRDEVILDTAAALSVTFSPDGQSLAWGTTESAVKVWRRSTGEVHVLRGHQNWVLGVAFSPDGKLIASASRDGTVRIWEAPPPA